MSEGQDHTRAFNLGSLLRSFKDDGRLAGMVAWNLERFIAREPRVVRFPKNKSLGDLYLLFSSALRPGWIHKGELGKALGEVIVPAGKKLELVMNERASRNLRQLARLDPGALQALDLSSCQVADNDLVHLQGLTCLESLNLSCNEIIGQGLVHLSEMKLLERLQLWGTELTDDGLPNLPALPLLRELRLSLLLKITDGSLTHLERFPSLEILDLHSTYLDDCCLPHLKRLTKLRSLDITYTKFSEDGFRELVEVLPHCRITWSRSSA